MNTRNLIIGSVTTVLVLLATWLAYSSFFQLRLAPTTTANIRSAHPTSESNLRFFNGWEFVDLNISSKETSPVSPVLKLPLIKQVRWSTDGSLVLLNPLPPSADQDIDDLAPIYAPFATRLEDRPAFWVVYDISQNTFASPYEVIGNDEQVVDAEWTPEGALVLITKDSESDVSRLYSLEYRGGELSVSKRLRIEAPLTILCGEYGGEIYAADAGGRLLAINTETQVTRTLAENVSTARVSPDSGDILLLTYRAGSDDDPVLTLKLLRGATTDDIASATSANLEYDPTHKTLYAVYTEPDASLHLALDEGTIKTLLLAKDRGESSGYLLNLKPLSVLIGIGEPQQDLVYRNWWRNRGLRKVVNLPEAPEDFETVFRPSYSIGHYMERGEFHVQLAGERLAPETAESVFTDLRAQGFEPDFQNIRWFSSTAE